MEEEEFIQLLEQFAVVRSRLYNENDARITAEEAAAWRQGGSAATGRAAASQAAPDEQQGSATGPGSAREASGNSSEAQQLGVDAFWALLRKRAAEAVGRPRAELFCQAFRESQRELVQSHLSLDDIERISAAMLALKGVSPSST